MDARGVEEMLHGDRSQWSALATLLDAHADEVLHPEGAWVSRDVYAHLARWMEHSTADLQACLEGRTLPPLSGADDEINARWQQADSALTLAEARKRAHAIFERRLIAIRAVPPARWSDRILEAMARADGATHYRAHRNSIVAE